jgi:hypothetical protein
MRAIIIALCLCTVTACSPEPYEQTVELLPKNRTPGRAARGAGDDVRTFPGAKIPFEVVDKSGDSHPVVNAESLTPDIATVHHIEDGTLWVEAHAAGTAKIVYRVAASQNRTVRFKVNRLAKKSIQPLYAAKFTHSGRPAVLGGGEVAMVARFEGAAGNDLTGVYDDIWTYEGEGVLSDPLGSDVATFQATDARGTVTLGTYGEQRTFPVVPSHDVSWIAIRHLHDGPATRANCANAGQSRLGTEFDTFEAMVAMGTPTHDIWGNPADEIHIEASGDAVIVRDSARSRRFRVENVTGPLQITVEWRELTVTRDFKVCLDPPSDQ